MRIEGYPLAQPIPVDNFIAILFLLSLQCLRPVML